MIESPLIQPEEKVPFTAEIRVRDFEKSLDYYTKKLGFSVFRIHREGKFAALNFGNALLMVKEEQGIKEKKGVGFFFRFKVKDLDGYYTEVKKKGAKVLGPPEERSWGTKRFYAEDPDGFKLQFIPE